MRQATSSRLELLRPLFRANLGHVHDETVILMCGFWAGERHAWASENSRGHLIAEAFVDYLTEEHYSKKKKALGLEGRPNPY